MDREKLIVKLIVESISSNGELEQICRSISSWHWKDLQQEICLFILTHDKPSMIVDMFNRRELNYWLTRVATNKCKPNDKFFQSYVGNQRKQVELNDEILNVESY